MPGAAEAGRTSMLTLSGYQLDRMITEGRGSLVYGGLRRADGSRVVVKVLREDHPSPEQIAWFTREFALTQSLQVTGVAQCYSLETDGHRRLMVLEDFGGTSLAGLGLAGSLDVGAFLGLAVQIATALGQVHGQRVVHRDINPSNIVFNPTTNQVKLIDFGIATVLPRENPTLRAAERLEGTLAYISPEQTGRMNRALDYRTDYYSLGATFYELLTGQPPFSAPDALSLVHALLAKAPLPPDQLRPDLPPVVAAIVLKLLAKNAEDRYQSTTGLIADLERCLHEWRATGAVNLFPLGRSDRPAQLQPSQQLYGREEARAQLLDAFDAAGHGTPGLVLVAGQAGIGKTALVRELYRPLTRQRAYLVTGKFDQLQRHIPYAALLQALRALVRFLLTEGDAQLTVWREHIRAALGPNGQVITASLPELEMLIGPQPAAPALGPVEAQHRLHRVFAQLLSVFGQAGHPLVLFLDDLQWADPSSLELLEALLTAPECHHLLAIGACRESDGEPLPTVERLCAALVRKRAPVQRLTLVPLSEIHVQSLLADTLRCSVEHASPLAALLLAKTGGNPFFLNEFLRTLYADELLTFDTVHGCWQWEIERIGAQGTTDNVVDLLTAQLRQLPPVTQRALTIAACIGHRFALGVLAQVEGQVPRETARALWPALEAGLILPLDETYKVMDVEGQEVATALRVEFQFAHDRVQQAVYARLGEPEKPAVHRRIGEVLQRQAPLQGPEPRLFEIVHHLNLGRVLLAAQEERDTLAALNLQAGQEARAAAAFDLAAHYLGCGLALLGADSWTRRYALTLDLHVAGAEAAGVNGHFDQVEALSRAVLERAESLLDKVPSYGTMLQAATHQNNTKEAVRVGLEILGLLGVRLPERPRTAHIVKALLATRLALAGKRAEDLSNLPEMTDPHTLAAMWILVATTGAAFTGAPLLVPILICAMVGLSVRHGNGPRSAAGYAGYGGLLCAGAGSIDNGYRFGTLAVRLSEHRDDQALRSLTQLAFNVLVRPWKEPPSASSAAGHAMRP
jgi:predicted ATPase